MHVTKYIMGEMIGLGSYILVLLGAQLDGTFGGMLYFYRTSHGNVLNDHSLAFCMVRRGPNAMAMHESFTPPDTS